MTYYIEQDGKIKLHDTDLKKLQRTLKYTPQFAGLEIKQTERPIVLCKFADTTEYQAEKRKEEVLALEQQTGLIRSVRELVLAENSGASEFVKIKAQQIEKMAEELRG